MEPNEKQLKIEALEIALADIDVIIENMKKNNNYSSSELNEFAKKRWQIWNEIYQVKKS
jgi:hypothetical protein